MPIFTMSVSDLVEDGFEFGLGPLDYPIFDETYRPQLNRIIIDHYMNYEIGQETESMFRFALNRKMREIMPYYNQRFESARITFDPMVTMSYTDNGVVTGHETGTTSGTDDTTTSDTNNVTTSGTTTANTTNSTDSLSRTVASDTPQTMLQGDEDYASSASDSHSTGAATGTNTTSTTGTQDTTESGTINGTTTGTDERDRNASNDRTVKGYNANPSELINAYRSTLININMEIVYELRTLFMQLWDNSDSYSREGSEYYGYGLTQLSGIAYF
jgi:hypothetical protein